MSDADQLFRVHAEQIGDVLQIALDCNGCRAKEKRISALEEEKEKLKALGNKLIEAATDDDPWELIGAIGDWEEAMKSGEKGDSE